MPLLTLATTEIRSKEPKSPQLSDVMCCSTWVAFERGSNYEMMNLLESASSMACGLVLVLQFNNSF